MVVTIPAALELCHPFFLQPLKAAEHNELKWGQNCNFGTKKKKMKKMMKKKKKKKKLKKEEADEEDDEHGEW